MDFVVNYVKVIITAINYSIIAFKFANYIPSLNWIKVIKTAIYINLVIIVVFEFIK
jgi:hypothetical protein